MKLLLFPLSLVTVTGHAYMSYPPSRNYLAYQAGKESCPHCLNAGTVGTVSQNSPGGIWPFPHTDATETRHGACGDPATGPKKYETAGEALLLRKGQDLVLTGTIKAHHKGHVEVRLCRPAATTGDTCEMENAPTQDCLNLTPLVRVDAGSSGSSYFVSGEQTYTPGSPLGFTSSDCPALAGQGQEGGPSDAPFTACFPERAYLDSKKNMPSASEGRGWEVTWTVALPDDLVCEHCVLQFYYATSNSCVMPGYRLYPELSDSTSFGMADCGSSTANYPEEFWNCADVSILDSQDIPSDKACIVPGETMVRTGCTSATPYSDVTPSLLPDALDLASFDCAGSAGTPPPPPQTSAPPTGGCDNTCSESSNNCCENTNCVKRGKNWRCV